MYSLKAPGDGDYYTLVEDDGTEVELARVTTIIGKTLAKPVLVEWAYKQTKDSIAGLSYVALNDLRMSAREWAEVLIDPDELEQWLKNNRMRPRDVVLDAADRGTTAHKTLEFLCETLHAEDEDGADSVALRILQQPEYDGWQTGVARWWLDTQPHVLYSEIRLASREHRFAGTCDLVLQTEAGVKITDLKSRELGRSAYDSDHVQTAAYEIAFTEMYPSATVSERSVLLTYPDGTYREVMTDRTKYDHSVFLSLLNVYNHLTTKEVK